MAASDIDPAVAATRVEIGTLTLPFEKLSTFYNTTGAVRLYQDHGLGMKVVGKRVDTLDRPLADRLREPQVQASLDHPNLARILSATEVQGGSEDKLMRPLIEIVTPYYELGSVHEAVVADRRPRSASEVIAIGSAMSRGLAELHRHGFAHRDMKSTNVFLTGDSHVAVVGDLGEVAAVDPTSATAPGIDTAHPWTAPEQVSAGVATPASDLNGLGLILAELCRGGFDYEKYDPEAAHARLLQNRPALTAIGCEVPFITPRGLRSLIRSMTRVDPAARPLSAHAVLDSLAAIFVVDWQSVDDSPTFKRWEGQCSRSDQLYAIEATWRPRLERWQLAGFRQVNAWQRCLEPVRVNSLADPAARAFAHTLVGVAASDAR